MAKLVEHTAEHYQRQQLALLPPGRAWPREGDTWFSRLFLGFAAEFLRVEQRVRQLLDEADPRQTNELLPEWEKAFGLPDPAYPEAGSVQQRRDALVGRIVELGGQSKAYFIGLAAALGYTVTITEYDEALVDELLADGALYDTNWAFTWQVNVPDGTVTEFLADYSNADDPLRVSSAELLEVVLGRAAPSHTILIFEYGA